MFAYGKTGLAEMSQSGRNAKGLDEFEKSINAELYYFLLPFGPNGIVTGSIEKIVAGPGYATICMKFSRLLYYTEETDNESGLFQQVDVIINLIFGISFDRDRGKNTWNTILLDHDQYFSDQVHVASHAGTSPRTSIFPVLGWSVAAGFMRRPLPQQSFRLSP